MMNKVALFIFTCSFIILSSCGQDYNSNTGDFGQYAPIEGLDSTTPDGTRLLAAYKVMQTKCFQCHSGWTSYKSSSLWTGSSLVSKGSTSGSILFTILKNNGGSMPPDPIAQLTSDELASIQTWIEGIP